jgi:hypothetical protein
MKKTLWLACIAVLGAGSAWAGPKARLVVDVPGDSDSDAVLEHLRGAFGDRFDARVADVAGSLERGFGPWGVVAPAEMAPCDADSLGLEQIQASLVEAEGLMQALEYEQALQMLEELDAKLCGVTEPMPAEVYARVPFLRGVIHYYAEKPAAARDAFRDAVLRQPEMEWDATYPPDPQQVFLDGVADAYRSDRIVLALDAADRPQRLLVNGTEVDAAAAELELLGPEHLLQVGVGDSVATVVLHTGGALRVELVGPQYVAQGLILDLESEHGAGAFAVLAAAAEDAGHREVVVLGSPSAEFAWQYDDIDRAWTSVSLVLSKKLAEGRKVSGIGGALIGAGAAVAVAGAVIGVRNYTLGSELRSEMEADPGLYDYHLDEYDTHRAGSGVGVAMLGVGSALVAVGVPLLVKGQAIQSKAVEKPQVTLAPLDGGVSFGLRGEF